MTGQTMIRQATPADRDTWAKLRAELWPTCPLERHILEIDRLLAEPGLVALAIISGNTVGFAEISLRHDYVEGSSSTPVPYLEGLYVAAAYRGNGIGTALLTFSEQWARELGYLEIASDAEINNHDSIRLHIGRGFADVGRTVHFVKKLLPEPLREGERDV